MTTVKLKPVAGKVSTAKPRTTYEKVCYTRPARKGRRVYSPADLKRVYKYVVGSFGYRRATCALLEASGIEELLEQVEGGVSAAGLCDYSIDLSEYAQYVPAGADEALGLPEGTVDASFQGCPAGDDLLTLGNQVRAALVVLILIWGAYRRVTMSRLYRLVIRRLFFAVILFELLDRLEGFIARLVPVLLILSDSLTELQKVCDDASEEDD